VDLDFRLAIVLGCLEGSIQWAQEGGAARDAEAGMLAFAYEGLEGFEFNVVGPEGGFDGLPDGSNLLGWELHSSMQTVKHPAQDFLGGIPDTFPVEDELLVGDGVVTGGASCGRRWEDLVDAVQ
jgi:hypothetical protein